METEFERAERWPKVRKKKKTEKSMVSHCRSLIALSLILSFLQFKPAPMYILDEVDAALDLSHTQNIGQLLRTRFKGSQFLVVSLKDGMFNNANVLFKTRFKDGTSVVEVGQEENKEKWQTNHELCVANYDTSRQAQGGRTLFSWPQTWPRQGEPTDCFIE